MPFWSRGGSEDGSSSSSTESNFTSTEDSSFPSGGSNFNSMPSSAGGAGGAGAGELEQFSMALRQQIMVQQVISNLTDVSFEKCVTGKPNSDALSGKDVSCIHSSVNKWLDSNEFLNMRLAKKQQAQSNASFS
mmetsp:Transcript_1823/g.1731  ORF Transcript_1823/g.1731 Transcript_1823/m.1731 type:complete len:133 (-) Transcript_1823:227-625(-)|eukprot:CAMPEP_0197827072 /NCGR_PEP_ID=MMETSP1437-20131217/3942_1 /TAXON_ID=49252 ORGANISM="Eucampia antarctica, Strain CCMP1452" /NCGR_SAMPLE_ID=MMETSP1437 /ASSEMBLY_ACC=CAM_ASM_001096 /LENGTH=132 /DNA_ID=CAMNT_0043427789 /DNA_START=52 /DNA_END=450 /DNA_ORIENTATION=-